MVDVLASGTVMSVYTCDASAMIDGRMLFKLPMSPASSALKTSVAACDPDRAPSQISAFESFSRT